MSASYVLTVSCPDQIGIVSKVSTFLADHQCMISEANHHADEQLGMFFMRNEISSLNMTEDLFKLKFSEIAERFDMQWKLSSGTQKKRVIIMVSKQDHCLYDLLYRWKSGEMDYEIPCVISNHPDLKGLVEWHGIPYVHIPVTPDNKTQAFSEVVKWVEHYEADTIVLARYMQIIPPDLCRKYPGQIINIHHSFLPSFIGAKPYHQAFERGVKLIGATCHYVTEDLDAGPIIEQEVRRVSHSESADEMVVLGKDVEKNALARGLKFHLEDRVLLSGNKTIVFA
ncbi:MAG: formyltetrahydrofolate deformylase [Thiomicrorhabdus chilensis]|uniref:formyltetrahydrofolate deformylase n=1 Tax=Thiomicrorhabdus chilensis TaxID=63656 RepID=UPI00299DBD78|nr:formyltetrahydrofolate deformylase [Thiomicrorhabdus chilensis]MDX1347414.1 formyltetrahydrofolate deformylase [Thiomicrorhabdus chilensis]